MKIVSLCTASRYVPVDQGYHSPLFLLPISSFSPPKPKRRRKRGDVGKMGGEDGEEIYFIQLQTLLPKFYCTFS